MEISILRCSSEATARNLFLPEKLESFSDRGGVHIHLQIQLCQVQQTGGHISHLFPKTENIILIMAEPTTQYVVASKDCKNPEAAFKIINYLIANEQTWVEEGVTSTEMGTADFYPLYNAYDNADEIETSYEVLTQYLAGEVGIDDVDFSTHKLLKNDMEAITELKKEPYDDFSLEYWNLDSDLAQGNLPRLVAIMVGDAPLVNEEYVPIYNVYNGQTETMEAKWANLKKMEEETFAKIIMGKADISEFDTFVENWKSQGGDQILKENQRGTGQIRN